MWEDNRNNRLRDEIGLFRAIVNLDVFCESHFIVILNKYDIFKQYVYDLKVPFNEYFKDYEGNNENAEQIIEFIVRKLLDQVRDRVDCKIPDIHFFVMNAINTECNESVFNYIHNEILQPK